MTSHNDSNDAINGLPFESEGPEELHDTKFAADPLLESQLNADSPEADENATFFESPSSQSGEATDWDASELVDLGDYRIIKEIGRGGMGVVYEAEQVSLGRRVAVKVLPRELLVDSIRLRQFRREARAAGRLHHTNIVPVFGVGEQNGFHYYVMQLIDGIGLNECVTSTAPDGTATGPQEGYGLDHRKAKTQVVPNKELDLTIFDDGQQLIPTTSPHAAPLERTLSPTDVASIGIQIAKALAYAHDRQVLHRDVKPGNLLMDNQGNAWITDFGLAKALDEDGASQLSHVGGTLRYMSPEQLKGTEDSRSDLYGLGITLYELLTQRPAFDYQNLMLLVECIQTGKLVPPRSLDPSIPRDLDTIVVKATASNPDHRYQTANELADDLERFQQDIPIRARRATLLERSWRWSRRNPALAMMSSVALLLFCSVFLISLGDYLRVQAALSGETEHRKRSQNTSRRATQALDSIFGRFSAGSNIGWKDHPTLRPQAVLSKETALLLQDLLVFYDELAGQSGGPELMGKAADAQRRVAGIHQRLGNYSEAVLAYEKAIEKYSKIPDSDGHPFQLAFIYNQIGGIFTLLGDRANALPQHQKAIETLRKLPKDSDEGDVQYELARSYLLLARRIRPGMGPNSMPPVVQRETEDNFPRPRSTETERQNLTMAIELLNTLLTASPKTPGYRHLSAICYRELASDHLSTRTPADHLAEARAITLLESLVTEFPSVSDYRYDLIETLAEFSVFGTSIAPEQLEEVRQNLLQAIDHGEQLMAERPNVPIYGAALVHANFKLAIVVELMADQEQGTRRNDYLLEAERNLRKATSRQSFFARRYPTAPAYVAWLGKFQLSLAQNLQKRKRINDSHIYVSRAIRTFYRLPDDSLKLPVMQTLIATAYTNLSELLLAKEENELAKEAMEFVRAIELEQGATSSDSNGPELENPVILRRPDPKLLVLPSFGRGFSYTDGSKNGPPSNRP